MFPYEYSKILKNTFLKKHLQTTASEILHLDLFRTYLVNDLFYFNPFQYFAGLSGVYLEPSQAYKKELFAKTVSDFQPLTTSAKFRLNV